MMHSAFIVKVLLLAASAGLIAGHGAIIAATGDAGGQGTALGSRSPLDLQSMAVYFLSYLSNVIISRQEHPT